MSLVEREPVPHGTALDTPPDTPPPGAGEAWRLAWLYGAALALLVGLAAGFFAQGAFFASGRWPVAVALVVAAAAALVAVPPGRDELVFPPNLAAAALAGWTLLRGVGTGHVGAAATQCLLLAGLVVVVAVCRRLPMPDRQTVVLGLVALGSAVALTAWLGVALHRAPWGIAMQGLWRGSSTLTYSNATAAVLVALALVAAALLVRRRDSVGLALALSLMLTGAGSTVSRAGGLTLLVGSIVLLVLAGWRSTARAVAAPALGALVALLALAPSLPAGRASQLPLALVGLLAGLCIAAAPAWSAARGTALAVPRWVRLTAVAGVVGGVAVLLVAGPVARAVGAVDRVRGTFDPSYRTDALRAALHLTSAHPWLGLGPGRVDLHWTQPGVGTGTLVFAHDEYAQVLVELGIVGLLLLLTLLGSVVVAVWQGRRTPYPAVWPGVVAALTVLLVHSGLDFLWSLPVIPLTAAALVGVVCRPVGKPALDAVTPDPSARTERNAK